MKVSYKLFVGEGDTPDFESGQLDHENKDRVRRQATGIDGRLLSRR